MEAYLDNSATTRCIPEVVDTVVKLMTQDYGNPSSMHKMGFQAETCIRQAKDTFARLLKVQEKEIYFTSGGTESNNLAIIGAALANRRRGMHLITTKIEHAAVSAPMHYLEEQGFCVDYLDVDDYGRVDVSRLEEMITEETILVSIMHVNNEIGAVEPIEEIGPMIKRRNPQCLFHVDDIQGFGKLPLYPKKSKIDMLSVSGHKIHGPKGTGILYLSEKAKVIPQILGGGQQKGMRSGTENVPGIAGLAVAADAMYSHMSENVEHLYQCKARFMEQLEIMEGVHVNGCTGRDSAPHIVSVSVQGVRSEVLLHSLEEAEIYVSAGSACSSNKPAVSATLKAIHVEKESLDSTIRFSFSAYTTEEEIDYAAKTLGELLPGLRKYSRK